jgi:hypothetical protein
MNNQKSNRQLAALEANIKKVLITLPVKAGNIAVNFALENFDKRGFLGHTFQPWRPRKNPNKWGCAMADHCWYLPQGYAGVCGLSEPDLTVCSWAAMCLMHQFITMGCVWGKYSRLKPTVVKDQI